MASQWTTPARWPALAAGSLHVWLAHLDAWREELEACSAVLVAEERERAGRFRAGDPRTRFELTRGVLRLLLGGYVGAAPASIMFSYNVHGKPELLEKQFGLHFNVSHTGNLAAFAFTRTGPVGVDIERVRQDMPRLDEIAIRHFAPGERHALAQISQTQRAGAFFRCWARKEAVLKARGEGIFGGLGSFEVNVDESAARLVQVSGSSDISLTDLPLVEGCAGAVAVLCAAASPMDAAAYAASPDQLLRDNFLPTDV